MRGSALFLFLAFMFRFLSFAILCLFGVYFETYCSNQYGDYRGEVIEEAVG